MKPARSGRRASRGAVVSSLRIIGGQWRGRRLPIIDAPGLRPTPDRIRETLFNWLAPRLPGARCLDLYAGTGALGIEALSREASFVTFAENNRHAVTALAQSLETLGLGADHARLHTGDALSVAAQGIDIVFIDPPFDQDLHARTLAVIKPMLASQARIYLEYPALASAEIESLVSTDYEILRSLRAGQVGCCLLRARADTEDGNS